MLGALRRRAGVNPAPTKATAHRLKPVPRARPCLDKDRADAGLQNKCSALCADGRGKPRPYEGNRTQAEACATRKASGQFAQTQREPFLRQGRRDLSYKRHVSSLLVASFLACRHCGGRPDESDRALQRRKTAGGSSLFLGHDECGGVEQFHVWTRVGRGSGFLRRRRR